MLENLQFLIGIIIKTVIKFNNSQTTYMEGSFRVWNLIGFM